MDWTPPDRKTVTLRWTLTQTPAESYGERRNLPAMVIWPRFPGPARQLAQYDYSRHNPLAEKQEATAPEEQVTSGSDGVPTPSLDLPRL